MASRSSSAQRTPAISDERLRNVIRSQLHRALNVDRDWTRAQLETQSGVSVHQIDQIMSRDSAKHRRVALEDAFSLALALGDRAINALFFTLGYAGQPINETDTLRPMAIVANVMGHLAVIGKAAADDHIDHQEEPDTTEAADLIIAELAPLSSAGRAA